MTYPPTGGFPPHPDQGQPAYPPQYGAPQYPQQPPIPQQPPYSQEQAYPQQPQYPPAPDYAQQPAGYPPQAPPTQGWSAPPPPTQGWQQPPPATQQWQQPATQGWQAPPPGGPGMPGGPGIPGGPGGQRGAMPWLPIGIIAGIVLLAVVGGILVIPKLMSKDEPSTPEAGAQPGATAGAATTTGGAPTGRPTKTSTSAAATPAKYGAPGDLCSTDLSALGIYSAKKEKTTPNVRNTGGVARSDCDFDLRTASGMKVTFGIKTQVYTTSKEAKQYFDSGYDLDKSRYFDADLTGIGEKSYGTNRDWDIGSKTSDYTIRVLDANLYLSISLVTFGNAFVPKDQLKPKAIDQVKAILGKLPLA
ncbi:hypothetical protein Dvina_45345 [Dactylosporangium vinaceum]|uniref:DUF3558 domain-containing protein n=1 Tax=Dactylosporangium vinaceum TaxID=53362 RepID=A0ABV5LYZ4_9ACTN|nr:hypothetical protein [Dactylosporangium vinaceum]UAB95196.1 hypothetical protein Dvina_45345 [Dactylosporangium vinaceum]